MYDWIFTPHHVLVLPQPQALQIVSRDVVEDVIQRVLLVQYLQGQSAHMEEVHFSFVKKQNKCFFIWCLDQNPQTQKPSLPHHARTHCVYGVLVGAVKPQPARQL